MRMSFRADCVAMLLAPASWRRISAFAQTIEEKAQICTACHGENGIPQEKDHADHLGPACGLHLSPAARLQARHAQERADAPIVEALEREEMLALAEYFCEKTLADLKQPAADAAAVAKAQRANVAVNCTACHLGKYQGDSTVPRLAGQSADYMTKTMRRIPHASSAPTIPACPTS